MIDSIFDDTVFFVEANSYERLSLWEKFNKKLSWEQECKGIALTLGYLDGRPVVVNFAWYKIRGYRVCFYYACSQVVDYRMVDDWLDKHFGHIRWDGTRRIRCDAMNIHLCFHCLDELDEKRGIR